MQILTLQILQILTALNTQVSINRQKHYKLYLPRWLCILTHILTASNRIDL